VNHLTDSDFKGVLYPSKASSSCGLENNSKIKASDGTSVAFRWSATQMENVGGIPVYDVLTINLAPLNASVTSQLSEAVLEFAFGKRKLTDLARSRGATSASGSEAGGARTHQGAGHTEDVDIEARDSDALTRTVSTGTMPLLGIGSVPMRKPPAPSLHERSLSQDVAEMHQRGLATMLFRYVYIGEFELTASYRKNESTDTRNRFLDIDHLTVNLPSYMYSSQVWTWADFASQIRRELLFTFAFRGVSNLAKIKLLPGYQRAHRGIKQGADIVKQGRRLVLKGASSGDRSVDTHVDMTEDMEPPGHPDSDEDGSDLSNSGDDAPSHREFGLLPGPSRDEEFNVVSSADRQVLLLNRLYGTRLSRVNSISTVARAHAQDPHLQGSRIAVDDGSRIGRDAATDGSMSSATNQDGRAAKPPRLAYFRRRHKDGP
jgi:Golgi-body localisation protein domain